MCKFRVYGVGAARRLITPPAAPQAHAAEMEGLRLGHIVSPLLGVGGEAAQVEERQKITKCRGWRPYIAAEGLGG
jgi:hypothetical protein